MFATGQTVCFREESPWPPLKKGGIPLINIYELTNGKLSGRILRARFEKKGEFLSTIVYDWTNDALSERIYVAPFDKGGILLPVEKR
jgi:hypothetical protein